MIGDLLHIENGQTVMGQDPAESHQRVVAEMFVIDVVELVQRQQVEDVMELESRHAGRFEQFLESGDEVVQVRDVRHDVVGRHQVGRMALFAQLAGPSSAPKNKHLHRNAKLAGRVGHVGGRFHTQDRNALRQEPPQEVAVVGGDLDHLAAGPELEARGHVVGVALAVVQHRLHVGREVRVLGKDGLAGLEFLQLHQEALVADVGVQREERLHPVEVFRLADGIGHRRHAQVRHRVLQLRIAKAAAGMGCRGRAQVGRSSGG